MNSKRAPLAIPLPPLPSLGATAASLSLPYLSSEPWRQPQGGAARVVAADETVRKGGREAAEGKAAFETNLVLLLEIAARAVESCHSLIVNLTLSVTASVFGCHCNLVQCIIPDLAHGRLSKVHPFIYTGWSLSADRGIVQFS